MTEKIYFRVFDRVAQDVESGKTDIARARRIIATVGGLFFADPKNLKQEELIKLAQIQRWLREKKSK